MPTRECEHTVFRHEQNSVNMRGCVLPVVTLITLTAPSPQEANVSICHLPHLSTLSNAVCYHSRFQVMCQVVRRKLGRNPGNDLTHKCGSLCVCVCEIHFSSCRNKMMKQIARF